jgi:hypothetical protein
MTTPHPELLTCGHCLRPVRLGSTGLRHFGFHVAHREHDCLRILQGEIDGLRAELAALRPQAAPACDMCGGTGELFIHADDCDDDLCALNGDEHSCVGQVVRCECQPHSLQQAPQPEAAEPVAAPVQPVAAMVDAETQAYAEGRSDQFEDDCTVVRLLFENLDDEDVMGSGFINTTRVRELLGQFDIPAAVECSGIECTRPECGAMGCTADRISTAREQRIAAASQVRATPPVSVERDASRWQPIETAPEGRDGEILAFKPGIGRLLVRWLDADHPDCEGAFWHETWSHAPIEGLTHWMDAPAPPAAAQQGDRGEQR